MANRKPPRRLICSDAEGNLDPPRGFAKQAIPEESQKQHHVMANDLKTILYGRSEVPSDSLETSLNQSCGKLVVTGDRLDIEGQHRWT